MEDIVIRQVPALPTSPSSARITAASSRSASYWPFFVTNSYDGINVIYPTMINVFHFIPKNSRLETLLLTLPGELCLVFCAVVLICLGHLFGPRKWTLKISWIGVVILGGPVALVTPYNKGLMKALNFLGQTFSGWAQYESVAFTQLGGASTRFGHVRWVGKARCTLRRRLAGSSDMRRDIDERAVHSI